MQIYTLTISRICKGRSLGSVKAKSECFWAHAKYSRYDIPFTIDLWNSFK